MGSSADENASTSEIDASGNEAISPQSTNESGHTTTELNVIIKSVASPEAAPRDNRHLVDKFSLGHDRIAEGSEGQVGNQKIVSPAVERGSHAGEAGHWGFIAKFNDMVKNPAHGLATVFDDKGICALATHHGVKTFKLDFAQSVIHTQAFISRSANKKIIPLASDEIAYKLVGGPHRICVGRRRGYYIRIKRIDRIVQEERIKIGVIHQSTGQWLGQSKGREQFCARTSLQRHHLMLQ